MEKKKSPVISIVMYILGIVFLAISAFMLVLAISYTRTYLESYDASFSDMWSNTLQYVIKEFVPYLGIGILCIGIGVAIKEMRIAGEAASNAEEAANAVEEAKATIQADEGSHPDYIKAMEKLEAGIKYLENDIDTTREILSIKIEEKEKRDAYRIRGLGADVMSVIESAQIEPVKPGYLKEQEPAKPIALFRVAQTMAMPEITQIPETPAKSAKAKKPAKSKKSTKSKKSAKPIPLFRVAQTMAMPEIPKVKKKRKAPQKKSQKAKKTK